MAENEAVRRLQASIDLLKERMRIDSNDLEYESHLRQKRQLQRILDRLLAKEGAEKKL
ncbi:aminoglycoside phosphotransferase [Mitsuokella jalaludinii]|uniref:aminoglycoside phosphotransferase n=1 Tax=Mitsuokella jalaludinii TaxID=187979 RepID=UPI001D00CC77|nr:aminoglycoside phosphotransferase [Mitsuokella jalaludinii]MCB5725814.1 aminoglycoside phosphotransferase [Mitsuokella jalaludinii]